MQCPKCGAEAGAAEFCPACLSLVGAPAKRGEEVERDLAQRELAAAGERRAALQRQSRQAFVWFGAIAVAVSVGVAVASMAEAIWGNPAGFAPGGDREPRVRCRADADCGVDPCGRPIPCASHVCTRKDPGPCPEPVPGR